MGWALLAGAPITFADPIEKLESALSAAGSPHSARGPKSVREIAAEGTMKFAVTYLTFDGNCRQAMEFYAKCLDAGLYLMPFSDSPVEVPNAEGVLGDRVMHSSLTKGSRLLMATDTWPGAPFQQGNNLSVCLYCESLEEIERLFTALSENGQVTMPLQDTFWNARFGTLTDQFGIQWMLNLELPKNG